MVASLPANPQGENHLAKLSQVAKKVKKKQDMPTV